MTAHHGNNLRIIRLSAVIEQTGLARSSIYHKIGEGSFPRPFLIGRRAVGWLATDVDQWIVDCAAARFGKGC